MDTCRCVSIIRQPSRQRTTRQTTELSPLQAGLRILPMAAVLGVSALLSPILGRVIGLKFTVAAGLAAVAGGLWQISAVSAVTTTYPDVVPGLLLVGLGTGLLLPTATNSVVGSVPQGDSGMGSASNAVALQVGGALGVAVIGSVLSTRYQDHMTTALAATCLQLRRRPSSAHSAVPSPWPLAPGAPPAPCSRMLPVPRC